MLVALLVHKRKLLLQFRTAVFIQAANAALALLVHDIEQAIALDVVRVAFSPIAGPALMGIPGIAARILTDWRIGQAASVPFAAQSVVLHMCLLMLLHTVAGAMLVIYRECHNSAALVAPCAAIRVQAFFSFVERSTMPMMELG